MDDILETLNLQHLSNNFRQKFVEHVMCLSDKELDELGVTKPTDRSRLRGQCLDYVKNNSAATETNKVKGKVVNDKDPNNIWISKDGDKDVVLNRHAKIILASVPVRSLIQDVKMGNVNMGVEDWAAFAVELFRKIGEDIKDRSLLMQVVIFIVIVIIEAMLGYVAYNLIQSVIRLFLSQLGYKDLIFLSINILREVMKYFNKCSPPHKP